MADSWMGSTPNHPYELIEYRPGASPQSVNERRKEWLNAAYDEAQSWIKESNEAQEMPKQIMYLLGQQWTARRPSYKAAPVNNLLLRSMEATIAILTDIRPVFKVTANNKMFDDQAELMTNITRAWWTKNRVDSKLAMALIYAYLTTGFLRIVWDRNLCDGRGDFAVQPLSVYELLPIGPQHELQDWEGCIYEGVRTLSWFRRTFPIEGSRVRPSGTLMRYAKPLQRSRTMGQTQFDLLSPQMQRWVGSPRSYGESIVAQAWYREFWVRDWSVNVSQNVVKMGAGNWAYEVKPGELLYPRGRLIITGGDDYEVMYDGPNYLWHGKWPFVMLRLKPVPWQIHGLCYSSDTEVLTRRGWILFKDAQDDDEFATRNPKTKAFEWQKAERFTNERYIGPMYNFTSRSVNLLVTPNHRMVIKSLPRTLGGGKSKTKAHGRFIHEAVITAAELALHGTTTGSSIPQTSIWEGVDIGEKTFKADHYYDKPVIMSGDDYCAFMGAFLSEGWTHKRDGVCISQYAKSKGFAPYNDLLTRILGVSPRHNGTDFIISRRGLMRFCKQFGLSYEKYVPLEILNASKRQLKIFWHHYMLGDGSFKARKVERNIREGEENAQKFSTVSPRLAGNLMEVAQKIGWSASVAEYPEKQTVRKNGKIMRHRRKYEGVVRFSPYMNVNAEEQHYDGTIHCVTVPNGTLYVRRNGKPSWCGNSELKSKIPLQDIVNQILAGVLDTIKKAVNPPLMFSENSFSPAVQAAMDPNMPNAKIGYSQLAPNPPAYQNPPQLPSYVQNTLQYAEQSLQDDSGLLDLAGMGRKKVTPAGDTLESLKEGMQTTMRLRGRYLEYGVSDLGEQMVPNFFQFYTLERRMWMFGVGGVTFQDVFDGNTESLVPSGVPAKEHARIFSFQTPQGSLLKLNQTEDALLAMALRRQGDMDRKTLYQQLDMEKVYQQVEQGLEEEAQKMQAAAMMGGGAEPGGGGNPAHKMGKGSDSVSNLLTQG